MDGTVSHVHENVLPLTLPHSQPTNPTNPVDPVRKIVFGASTNRSLINPVNPTDPVRKIVFDRIDLTAGETLRTQHHCER